MSSSDIFGHRSYTEARYGTPKTRAVALEMLRGVARGEPVPAEAMGACVELLARWIALLERIEVREPEPATTEARLISLEEQVAGLLGAGAP